MSPIPKILVVDDEIDFREAMESILVGEGYEVLLAENGEKALELARSSRPDLVLTDIVMPDVSGLQLARSIKQTIAPEISVITVTGYPYHQDRAHEQNIDLFLTKPLQIQDLLAALNICLENQRG